MILQVLTRYYEDLLQRGEIAAPGWSPAKISFALCLDKDGQVTQVVPTMEEITMGKKTVLRPQSMILPSAVEKTSNAHLLSNFLWDDSNHFLGIDQKGNIKRSMIAFSTAAKLHHTILDGVDSPVAKAILAYFDTWELEKAAEHPALANNIEAITSGGNLLFRIDGIYPQKDNAICAAWQQYWEKPSKDTMRMQCLATGLSNQEIARTHPKVKGSPKDGFQTMGNTLVSFNNDSESSYGHEQSYNAPVGKYAAFAYTSALNHLLADKGNVQHIGDTTVVCWAEGAEPQYDAFAMGALFGGEAPAGYTEEDVRAIVKRLAEGKPCEELDLHPDRTFYILGLAPNAARLSVRFFLRDTFGRIMKNINDHNERMEIVRPANDNYITLPMWAMLRETDKTPSPAMAGATARAIFTGGMYPVSLLENTMLRIRAERSVTRGRAAIIKAYYLKNTNTECPKEVLTVALNEESRNIPYTLGRLFSVYEAAQKAANPGINTTIKDRYFNSAAATPAMIFPILGNLYQKHLRKLEGGSAVYFDKQVMELKGILQDEYPMRLTLPQQGSFDLGYYHQTQKRYTKKEDK